MNVSAVIITKNEERNIGRCLDSLKPVVDELIVVDSGSTDATEQICRDAGASFVFHPWEGFSEQKNFAETLARYDWILSIDADEALSGTLKESILKIKEKEPTVATVFSMRRLTNFCGQWIKHCGWYPDEKTRLWRKGTAHWDGVVHEQIIFSDNPATILLNGDLFHYSYYSFTELAERQNHYATLAAQKEFKRGKKGSTMAVIVKPCWKFIRDYFFKLGILDGYAGYTICRTNAYYTFVKYTTLKDLARRNQ